MVNLQVRRRERKADLNLFFADRMAVAMETETEAGTSLARLGSGPGLYQPLHVREFHPLAL